MLTTEVKIISENEIVIKTVDDKSLEERIDEIRMRLKPDDQKRLDHILKPKSMQDEDTAPIARLGNDIARLIRREGGDTNVPKMIAVFELASKLLWPEVQFKYSYRQIEPDPSL